MHDTPLITPDTRRRLQQRYEEAMRLSAREPCDLARVHDVLAECLRADPGNILYLDALLANLRRWRPKPSWFQRWIKRPPAGGQLGASSPGVLSTEYQVLSTAPDELARRPRNSKLLRQLAEAAGACDFDEAEVRYLFEARSHAPDDALTLRQLARALTRQGRFEEAVGPWFAVLAHAPDSEATQAVEDLKKASDLETTDGSQPIDVERALQLAQSMRSEGLLHAADCYLARAQFAGGGDLRILEEREELRLAQSAQRLSIARARAAADAHPKAQSLVGRMEQEHNRLEIDIFHLRSERHPDDLSLRLELARRLKRAGNYSGAIQRLEEARGETRLAAEVLLELGECWQHLRQFEKALNFYRQAAEADWVDDAGPREGEAPAEPSPRPLVGALYRIGVLAAAMDRPQEAKAALLRLVAIEPGFKDARERLDKLP